MRKKVLVPVILSLIPSVLLCARDATDDGGGQSAAIPSTTQIRRLIQTKGAKVALAELTTDTEKWDRVLDRMTKGEQEWLEIVSAEALAAAPKKVIEVLEPVVGLDILCQNDASVGVLAEKRLRCLSMLDTLEAEMRAAKERGDME